MSKTSKQINQNKRDAYMSVNLKKTKSKLLLKAENKYPGVARKGFHIDDMFELDELTRSDAGELHFRQGVLKDLIPYSQPVFKRFFEMPKYPVGREYIYRDNSNGNIIYGVYLLGYNPETEKQTLFSLSFVMADFYEQNNKDKAVNTIKLKENGNNLSDFNISIKLDVCTKLEIPTDEQLRLFENYKNNIESLSNVQKNEAAKLDTGAWLSLARLDSLNSEHPDYKTGIIIIGPHLHINSEENVIRSTQDMSYMPAITIEQPNVKTENLSKSELLKSLSFSIKHYMKIFTEKFNIDISLNPNFTNPKLNNNNKSYVPGITTPMFDMENTPHNLTPDLLLMSYLEQKSQSL